MPCFLLDKVLGVAYNTYDYISFFGGIMTAVWNSGKKMYDFSLFDENVGRLARNLLSLSLSLLILISIFSRLTFILIPKPIVFIPGIPLP
jgi:hypothetical protein